MNFWWSDKWDAREYAKDYDFSKGFFEQFKNLFFQVPLPARVHSNSVNSDYCNNSGNLKDCYLCFNCDKGENCYFGINFHNMKDCVNFTYSSWCESSANVFNVHHSYCVFDSFNCEQCIECSFCFDCVNCQYCVGCVGLKNKKYHIFNQEYSEKEYKIQLNKLNLNSYSSTQKILSKVKELSLLKPKKYGNFLKNKNFTGNYVFESKDVFNCFFCKLSENVKDVQEVHGIKDAKDVSIMYLAESGLYECCMGGINSSKIKFCIECHPNCFELEYCFFCPNSKNCFACVGLTNAQYCILNKQYYKEEYFEMVEKIKKHMNEMPYVDKLGRVYKYGEFFPPEFSPFAYNETTAFDFFELNKKQVEMLGCGWKDKDEKDYKVTITTNNLLDDIKGVDESILEEIIGCIHNQSCDHQCTKAFKIIKEEFKFYKKMNLPLPRLCPNCRHYERLSQRNPLKLWHRKCMKEGCMNEFETTYAPDRPEIVYCEKCYQNEIY